MSKIALTQILVLISAVFSLAQGLAVKPSIDPKEQWDQFERAAVAWREVSKDLEKEFLRQPPEKALRWINRASEKAAAMVEARDAFYKVLVDQIRSQISLLHPGQAPQIADLRRASAQTLAGLAADRKRLAEMKVQDNGRPETTLLNEQTERQLQVVRQLEDNLRDQAAALDGVEQAAASLSASKSAVLKSLEGTLQLIEKQAELDRGETSLWQDYYSGLRELVNARLPIASTTELGSSGKKTSNTKKK
jgi:hypothetical protein